MSLLDVAPIIEQMLLMSDNVSDLNFSCGQKPQVEINGTLYAAIAARAGPAHRVSDGNDRDVDLRGTMRTQQCSLPNSARPT